MKTLAFGALASLAIAGSIAACSSRSTVAPAGTTSAVVASSAPSSAASIAAPAPSTAIASASVAPAPAPAPDPLASPEMVDAEGKPLPQTEDKPSGDSPAFQKRAELLFEAIKKDDASIAEPSFFPKSAYAQVKDIPKAERDWETRLWRLFKRDIHEYHQHLGKDPESVEYAGVVVADKHSKWITKNTEGNRLGYFRAFGTVLQYKNAKGKLVKLEVTSIISWRGEWFVVHLHGTK
jgi:hypothetical protein